ncbi:MAG: TolC family protein [Deltaproteobacteria bacterium]|jgi:outer membrane protein|nr:TolC family protein [Deltaproteobacteria bacterium]
MRYKDISLILVLSGALALPGLTASSAWAAQAALPAPASPSGTLKPSAPAQSQYTLDAAVRRALDENFSVRASEANLQAAENWRKSARGSFGPALGTSYGYSHMPNDGAAQMDDEDLYTWRVSLTQDLFSGFATLAAYQRAALQRDSAEASLAKARLDLILTVQQNFFMYLKAGEDVRSATDSYNRLAEQLKITKSFYDVGLRPRLDVLQAEVNVSEAEDTLLRARNMVETQRARLNTLLNIPLEAQPEYVGDLSFIPFMSTLEQCLEQAYQRRPDIIIARKAVSIAEQDKTTAASDFYPTIQGDVTWSTRGNDWTADGSDSRPTNYSEWSVGVTGSMTVFEWGRTYYEVQQTSHLIGKVRAEEADLRQEVTYQVQARLLELDNAAKRIVVARKGLEQAGEAYRVALARYKSQVGTSIDVLDAQARLTAAEVSLTGAQADYLSALAAIFAAIGEENPGLAPGR